MHARDNGARRAHEPWIRVTLATAAMGMLVGGSGAACLPWQLFATACADDADCERAVCDTALGICVKVDGGAALDDGGAALDDGGTPLGDGGVDAGVLVDGGAPLDAGSPPLVISTGPDPCGGADLGDVVVPSTWAVTGADLRFPVVIGPGCVSDAPVDGAMVIPVRVPALLAGQLMSDLSDAVAVETNAVGVESSWLPTELERAVGTTSAVVWLRLDGVDANMGRRVLWIYLASQPLSDAAPSPFSGDYAGVWHLNEKGSSNSVDTFAPAKGFDAALSAGAVGSFGDTNVDGTSNLTVVEGQLGGALAFQGGFSILVPAHAALNVGAQDTVTLEAWVRPDALDAEEGVVVAWQDNNCSGCMLAMRGQLARLYTGSATTWCQPMNHTDSPSVGASAGQWRYVVAGIDRVTDQVSVSIDGNRSGQGLDDVSVQGGPNLLYIGAGSDGRSAFAGALDELRIRVTSVAVDEARLGLETRAEKGQLFWAGELQPKP